MTDKDTLSSEISCTNQSGQSVIPSPFGKPATLPALWNRYTKEQIEEAIERNYGIITNLCFELDCSPKQLYNCLDKFQLREYLKDCKKQIVSIAENAMLQSLKSDNEQIRLRAAEITLKSLGKDEWSSDPQTVIQQAIISDSQKKIQIQNIFGLKSESNNT